MGRVLRVYLAGLLTTINIPVVVYLAYGSTANFLFRGSMLRSIYQKNGKAMAFVLVQESGKLTKYFESYRDFPRCKVNANGL